MVQFLALDMFKLIIKVRRLEIMFLMGMINIVLERYELIIALLLLMMIMGN